MQAIQRLRAQALANGALTSTAQQVVVQEGGYISIEPTQPAVIYVPTYDWDAVYDMAPNDALPADSIRRRLGRRALARLCLRLGARENLGAGPASAVGPQRGMAYYRDWRKGHELDRGGSHWRPDPHWRQMRARAVGQARADYARRARQAAIIPPAPSPRPDGHANVGHFNAPRENGNQGRAAQNSQPPRAHAPRTEPRRSEPARTESHRAAPAHSEPAHSAPARSAPTESGGRGIGAPAPGRGERDR
jgi:hypothetical protein